MAYRERKIDKDWSLREIVAPDGKIPPWKYFYKKREVPQVYLEGHLVSQLKGYCLIEKDLRSAITWLKKIDGMIQKLPNKKGIGIAEDREIFDTVKGLWVAALTFYGKSFTTAEGRSVKLHRELFDKLNREKHDTYIHVRNNFAAHSGSETYETVRITLVLNPKKDIPLLFTELLQQDYFSQHEENDLRLLAEHAREHVLEKIGKLKDKIMEEEVLPKGAGYWRTRMKK